MQRLTGLPGATDAAADGSVAASDGFWLDACGKVVRHGEPMRFEHHYLATAAWFDVRVTRLGGATSRRVAVVINDNTERKRQRRHALASHHRRHPV